MQVFRIGDTSGCRFGKTHVEFECLWYQTWTMEALTVAGSALKLAKSGMV